MEKEKLEQYVPTLFTETTKKFPCIFKPEEGYGGKNIKVCHNEYHFKLFTKWFIDKKIPYFVEEYIIDKNEYNGYYFVKNGTIVFSIYYKGENEKLYSVKQGGFSLYEKISFANNMDNIFDQIFKKLKYSGFATSNFKIMGNKIKILEINPRLGGTLIKNASDLGVLLKFL